MQGGDHDEERLDHSVHVECDELSEEERAEIEVRHLGELGLVGARSGVLRLRCESSAVVGTWIEGDVSRAERSVSRSSGDHPGEVLHWLASLLIESLRRPGSTPIRGTGVSPQSASSVPVVPAPPPEALASPPPRESLDSSPSQGGETAPSGGPLRRFEFGGSVVYEHWGREVPGLLGPSLTADWLFSSHFALTGSIGWQWSPVRPSDFSVSEGMGALGLAWIPNPWVRFEVSPELKWTAIGGPSGVEPGSSLSAIPGVELASQFSFPPSTMGGFLRVGARLQTVGRVIALDGQDVLTVPEARVFLALGVFWRMGAGIL